VILSITIPGPPVAKGRPRISTRGGFARAYTPAKTQRYEDMIKSRAYDAMAGRPLLDEALAVEVIAFVAPPQSMSKVKLAEALAGERRPVTRPDLDNYVKAALDGMNGIVFRDDSLVTDLSVRKRYSQTPRLEIVVSSVAGSA
jgi:Holliday junction resolvase RusA-like endonuclease